VADLAGGVLDHSRRFGSCRFGCLGCLAKVMVRPAAKIADNFSRVSRAFATLPESLF
jgi:hypothetical protein